MYDKCVSVHVFPSVFTLNWHVLNVLVRKQYLTSVHIDFRAKMEHKGHERVN